MDRTWRSSSQFGLNVDADSSEGSVTAKLKVAPSAMQAFCFTGQQSLWNAAHTRCPIDIARSVAIETWETCLLTGRDESWDRSRISESLSHASRCGVSAGPIRGHEVPPALCTGGSFLVCVVTCQEVTEQLRDKNIYRFFRRIQTRATAQDHEKLQTHSIEFLMKITSGRLKGPGRLGRDHALLFYGSGLTDRREEVKCS